MIIENHPAFAPKLPRICYVLGGEKTPLKIGEQFKFYSFSYHIDKDGSVIMHDSTLATDADTLAEMINHPEKIIRHPQFSEDEKAFLRLLVENGLPWLARSYDDDECGCFFGFEYRPHNELGNFVAPGDKYSLPLNLLPQITPENSPFDAATYLESEASK